MGVSEAATTREASASVLADAQPRARRRRPGSVAAPMVVAFALALVATYWALSDDAAVQVAMATADVAAGSPVGRAGIELVEVRAPEQVLAGLLTADRLAALDDAVAAAGITAGQLLAAHDLRPAAAPERLRAMSLPVDRDRAVAGGLAAGDRIDVIAVADGPARYVATDLAVLAVAEAGGALGAGAGSFAVVVAVDDATALALADALEAGAVNLLRATGATPIAPAHRGGAAAEPGAGDD